MSHSTVAALSTTQGRFSHFINNPRQVLTLCTSAILIFQCTRLGEAAQAESLTGMPSSLAKPLISPKGTKITVIIKSMQNSMNTRTQSPSGWGFEFLESLCSLPNYTLGGTSALGKGGISQETLHGQ